MIKRTCDKCGQQIPPGGGVYSYDVNSYDDLSMIYQDDTMTMTVEVNEPGAERCKDVCLRCVAQHLLDAVELMEKDPRPDPEELLPCPFCGGKAKLYRKPFVSWVACVDCPVYMYREHDYKDAIRAWNRRTDGAK